jgi:predicted NBD/HSP70 family sugar kinase
LSNFGGKKMAIIAAIEAGGTKFVCGLGDEKGNVLERVSFSTTSPEETMGNVIGYFKDKTEDVITEEETTEEIYTSSGISTGAVDEDEILSGNIINSIRARTPWLFITLIGEFSEESLS